MLPRRCRRRPVCPMLIVNILEQFRQVWRCHVMQTLVDQNAESEYDVLGDVEPMYVVMTNVCQPTVKLVSVGYNLRHCIHYPL